MFAPFALGYFLSYLLRTVNAVIAPDLSRDLGVSATELGLLTSTYFLAFAGFQLPLGVLLDRYGPRRVEAALLLLAAAGCAVFAAGAQFSHLAVGRALIGLGVSACLMAAFKSFHQWFAQERQPALVGAIMAAGGLGALAASTPLELTLPLLGWRGVFVALAALTLLCALLVWTVPDHDGGVAPERLGVALRGLRQVFGNRVFWRYAPQNALITGGFMALHGLWAVPWLMDVGAATRSQAAQHLLLFSAAMLCGFVSIAVFATPLARRGVSVVHLYAGGLALGLGTGVAIILEAGPSRLLWTLYGLAASANNLAYPVVSAAFPTHYSGRATTAYNLMAFVGAFALQWGYGAMLDVLGHSGWTLAQAHRASFAALLALQFAAFAVFLAGRRAQK